MPYDTHAERDFPIVDFGGHIVLPDHVPEFIEPLDDIVGPVHNDPDMVAENYADAGIDRVVLSQPPWMGRPDVEGVRASNDALRDVVAEYDQFHSLAALPTAAGGDAAAEEFERCLEDGFNGGTIETESGGIELDDEEVEPIFDVAEKHDAPLLVHPKIDDSLHPEVLDDTYRLNAIFGREAALSESIFRVIHKGILDERPDLDLVFHHLGGNIAGMIGRAHLHLDMGRWPGQESIKPWEEFKAQLEERVYVDTSGFWGYHTPMRAAHEEFPSTQILFGTDFPYEPRDADELARHATSVLDVTSDRDSAAILGGNTLDLLVNVDE